MLFYNTFRYIDMLKTGSYNIAKNGYIEYIKLLKKTIYRLMKMDNTVLKRSFPAERLKILYPKL